jgi:iron complex outermembrane recepter protein
MRRMTSFALALLAGLLFTYSFGIEAQSPTPGTIEGRVVSNTGAPAAGAQVTLLQARRRTTTDAAGAFRFANVAPGRHLISVESTRFGTGVAEINVAAGQAVSVEIALELAVHSEQIVVSAGGESRTIAEVYQPVDVLGAEELTLRLGPSLGETLNQQPGVTSTYFGPASSRPIIRGLGGDRIRVLESGLGTGDASNVSPDHAVTFDPMNAERIEIVRGPATLLYGSNAVGGVVNIIDDRIPDFLPSQAVTGSVNLLFGSVSDERSGGLRIQGGAGSVAWNVNLSRRKTDDFEIPGPALHEHDDDEEEPEDTGFLENSDLKTESGSVGLSWIRDQGLLGISFSGFDTNYGIPGGHGHGHGHDDDEEEEEEFVRTDMKQRRIDLRGERRINAGPLSAVRFRLGRSDYEHAELEGEEVGTFFENEALEGRLELSHRQIGRLTGAFGFQAMSRDFAAAGEEAFVPPSTTDQRALFLYEELASGNLRYQFGARWENTDVKPEVEGGELLDRSFSGLSASAGVVWLQPNAYAVALSLARAVRAPTAEELFSDGPHAATRAYEIGNPLFDEERSLGVDLSLRKLAGRFSGELNLFTQRFSDFIYEQPTGDEEDGLPVFQFFQDDARFVGAELHGHIHMIHTEPHHLNLELSGDIVRGELSDGRNLPRISPPRIGVGLRYRGPQLWGLIEARRVMDQGRVADFEEETDGYTMLNAAIGYRFFFSRLVHDITLRGMNLTDELARSHVSPLKEFAPLPGRDISIAYRVAF